MTTEARDPRRRFSARERAALLIAAASSCTECGDALGPDFHADHRDAWALGGGTDVINGQALCPICNRRKSNQPTVTNAPIEGQLQAEGCDTAAGAAALDSRRRNPARMHESAGAGYGGALECHKETLS